MLTRQRVSRRVKSAVHSSRLLATQIDIELDERRNRVCEISIKISVYLRPGSLRCEWENLKHAMKEYMCQRSRVSKARRDIRYVSIRSRISLIATFAHDLREFCNTHTELPNTRPQTNNTRYTGQWSSNQTPRSRKAERFPSAADIHVHCSLDASHVRCTKLPAQLPLSLYGGRGFAVHTGRNNITSHFLIQFTRLVS